MTDPQATLRAALTALYDGEADLCERHLREYDDWRRRGGFEPPLGDHVAARVEQQLRKMRRTGRVPKPA